MDFFLTQFILMGLTDQPDLQLPLFFLFLKMHMITVMGNLGLVILIQLNSPLHTPMWFFLINLSFIDLCYFSVFIPKMVINLEEYYFLHRVHDSALLFLGFFFFFFVISEIYVLTSMAYDICVAISKPLLYHVAMFPKVCSTLCLVPT